MESRPLSASAHAPSESAPCYGLATTETHADMREISKLVAALTKRAAKRLAGANNSMRTEGMLALKGIRSFYNHYVLKELD